MRIGIIGDALDGQYAGIHYYTRNLLFELSELSDDLEIYVVRSKPSDERKSGIHEVVVPQLWWIPGFVLFRLFVLIPLKLRKLHLDAVIETAHFGPFFLPKEVLRVTVVHDITSFIRPEWHTWRSRVMHRLFFKAAVKRTDLIITNSQFTKDDLLNLVKIDPAKVHPVHLGVSPHFRPVKDQKTLGMLGIYKPYLLYLGTIEPRKNLVRLIHAFELFKKNNPGSPDQLIMAGKVGWKSREVIHARNTSAVSDDIILLGYVDYDHLPALITGCRVFVYPSLYEGFGMPVLEALACGALVVASGNTCLPEVGRDYVRYFDPLDVSHMAQVIDDAYHQPDTDAGLRSSYARSATWSKTAQEIWSLIRRRAGNKKNVENR